MASITSEVAVPQPVDRYRGGAMTDVSLRPQVGSLLRDWRSRRRRSQLDLALDAGVSARHLSFVETGRARPSAEMVLHLAAQLDVPLRERNRLLLAAGYAPVYEQRPLGAREMGAVRGALDALLAAHEPFPAAALDGGWNLLAANRGIAMLTEGVAPALLQPPVNVLRVSLHPDGMAPRIRNLGEWREHLLDSLARRADHSADPGLTALLAELRGYPGGGREAAPRSEPAADIAVPLRLEVAGEELSFLSAITTFGTAVDITVAELHIESFFPADLRTAAVLRARATV